MVTSYTADRYLLTKFTRKIITFDMVFYRVPIDRMHFSVTAEKKVKKR